VLKHWLVVLALVGCGDDGSHTPADAPMVTPDAPEAPACVALTGPGTMHGSISADETWLAADSPHIVPFDIELTAKLTISPCAVVQLAKSATITVRPGGSFVAMGEVGQRVTIQPRTVGMVWASIRSLGGDISLSHTDLSGGGDPLSTNAAYAGTVHLQTGTLHVDDVSIEGSLSQGVYIDGSVGFDATSKDLRIHGSVGYPVHVYPGIIGSVPTGTYTGNGHDAIAIAGSGGSVSSDQTMHDRGVPYHVGSGSDGGRFDVNSMVAGTVAVLTIEPGVTIQFPAGGMMNVSPGSGPAAAQGALIAIGTAAKKIVFTSDGATTDGSWLGLVFGGTVDSRTVLQHGLVDHAGGSTVSGSNSCPYAGRVGANYAAIRIIGPAITQFITDTEIPNSARDGIDRGWRADIQPDFLPTNTITTPNGCKQTVPALANNSCPPTPACP
jgi:hypothetical protein